MVVAKLMPFILFLLFANLGYAQHFDPGVIHVLERMNQGKQPTNYAGALCILGNPINTDNSKTNARDMNECVVALCGFPSENKSVFVTNLNFDQYITNDLRKKIDALTPDLNKSLDKIKKNHQELIAEIEKQILKNGALNSNSKEWSDSFRSNLSKSIFEPFLEVSINPQMPIGKRLQLKMNPPVGASEEFKKELHQYADSYTFYSNNNYTQFIEKGLYSESEMISLAKERLKKLKRLYHDDFKVINDTDQKFYEASAKSIEEMIAREIEGYSYSIFSSLEFMEMEATKYDPSLKKFIMDPACADETNCEKIYKEYLEKQNIGKHLSEFKKSLEDPKVREKALNNCKAQIIATATTSSDKKVADRIVKQVKQQISSKVFTRFSNHSKGILQDYFDDNIKISNRTLKSLIKDEDDVSIFKNRLKNYNNDDSDLMPMNSEAALAQALNLSENPDDSNAYADFDSPCLTAPSNNAWDSYLAYDKVKTIPREKLGNFADMPEKDHLFISDFTCHHELRGKSVVAHELGHAINQIFATSKISVESAKFYNSIRACATENYVEFIPDRVNFSHPGDGVRTEEDTADLLAYMAYPASDDLFTCSLVQPSNNEKSYSDLSLITNDGNSHSTPMYRLIVEAVNKGVNLPISCQKALEPMKDKLRVKKCIP